MLISTDTLALHLHDPQWFIFDCRHDLMDHAKGEALYRAGHIPGARFAAMETDLAGEKSGKNGRHPLPSPAAFAAFLARNGVNDTSMVVAYDDAGGQFAARLWWLARWIGLKNVGLLDGGLPKWTAESRPVSRDVPAPTPTALRARADPLQVWSAAEVLAHLPDADFRLLDARAPERYRGDVEPVDPVAGHIPHAVNRFTKLSLNPDLTMRAPEALREEFSALIGNAKTVVHQCGSGVTACLNIFAMEHAGLPGSKLYAGSWSEWIADSTRPVVLKGQ